MDLDRTPAQLASDAAEAIRALNHRSLDPKAFPNPADVSDTAAGIAAVIQRLPQALQQLQAGLNALYDDNRIRLADRHPSEVSQQDIAHAISTARLGLQDARDALGTVEEHLRSSIRVLGNLGAPWPDDDSDEG